MSETRYLIGDTRNVLAAMPAASVDLVLSSPPFLALRSYLPADYPDKLLEIGSEATPAEFLDVLLEVTALCRRVLTPTGTLAFELGDTYSGSGQSGWERDAGGYRREVRSAASAAGVLQQTRQLSSAWPQAKSLCMIPEAYRMSLAYGRNILTGATSPAGQWRVRNVVRWCRPNPPVGALGDKFRPATSEMVIACTSAKRWFDLDAVRTDNPAGAPPLDWWEIPTEPYLGSHYATWPTELLRIPILAMCPAQVCRTCGEPRRRIVGDAEYVKPGGALHEFHGDRFEQHESGANRRKVTGSDNGNMSRQAPTLGWTDCGCSTDGTHWRRGHVLDPFGGTGTTAVVANGNGRDCTLIDIDARNLDLARERVGMFMNIETPNRQITETGAL